MVNNPKATIDTLEQSEKLTQLKVRGFHAWYIVRPEIYHLLLSRPPASKQRDATLICKAAKALLEVRRMTTLFFCREKKDVCFFSNVAMKKDLIDKKVIDSSYGFLFMKVYEESKKNYLFIDDFSCDEKHYAIKPNICIQSIYLLGKLVYISKRQHAEIKRFKGVLKKELDSSVEITGEDKKKILKRAEKILRNFVRNTSIYNRLFKHLNAKILHINSAYSAPDAVAGAKLADMLVLERQHGIINTNHLGYSFPIDISKENLAVPDKLLLYDNKTKESLIKKSVWEKEDLIITGNDRLEYWKQKRDEIKKHDIFTVLFTAQWTNEKELSDFIERLSEKITNEGLQIKLTVKKHPAGSSEKHWKKLAAYDCVTFLEADDRNLFSELIKSHMHASIYSSTLYESYHLGVPTCVIKLKGWEFVEDLLDRKGVLEANTRDEFLNLAEKIRGQDAQKARFNSVQKDQIVVGDAHIHTLTKFLDDKWSTPIEPQND